MKIQFGTEGWRALIDQDFNLGNVQICAQATAEIIKAESTTDIPRVIVGYDTRLKSDLFAEAVEFARAAIESDSEYWQGYTLLGSNLIRLGEEEEGKANLEISFENDPFNVHSGGRGLPAIVRPYASRVSGVPISMKFRAEKKLFTFGLLKKGKQRWNTFSKDLSMLSGSCFWAQPLSLQNCIDSMTLGLFLSLQMEQ